MTCSLGTPNPAAPLDPPLPFGAWSVVMRYHLGDETSHGMIRQSVAKRVRLTLDPHDAYALGRFLEELARTAGATELGRFLARQARYCGSGMQDGDLGKGAA
jgi:hypothetical protein